MLGPDDMGRDEGDETGPEPGKGAVMHHSSGEADFDGLPGDALPPKKDAREGHPGGDRPAPPEESVG
jgi:hypothetical protein